jgi:hypothetical protein
LRLRDAAEYALVVFGTTNRSDPEQCDEALIALSKALGGSEG